MLQQGELKNHLQYSAYFFHALFPALPWPTRRDGTSHLLFDNLRRRSIMRRRRRRKEKERTSMRSSSLPPKRPMLRQLEQTGALCLDLTLEMLGNNFERI